jgi:hypothetical protein
MDGHTQEPLSERGHDHANCHPGLFSELRIRKNYLYLILCRNVLKDIPPSLCLCLYSLRPLFVGDPHSFTLLQFLQNVIINITKVSFMEVLGTIFARSSIYINICTRIQALNCRMPKKMQNILNICTFFAEEEFSFGIKVIECRKEHL